MLGRAASISYARLADSVHFKFSEEDALPNFLPQGKTIERHSCFSGQKIGRGASAQLPPARIDEVDAAVRAWGRMKSLRGQHDERLAADLKALLRDFLGLQQSAEDGGIEIRERRVDHVHALDRLTASSLARPIPQFGTPEKESTGRSGNRTKSTGGTAPKRDLWSHWE